MTEACWVAEGLFLLANLSFWEGQKPNLNPDEFHPAQSQPVAVVGGVKTPRQTAPPAEEWLLKLGGEELEKNVKDTKINSRSHQIEPCKINSWDNQHGTTSFNEAQEVHVVGHHPVQAN